MEIATVGGGCFWCVEAVFQNVEGISSVISGYAGGHVLNPSYRDVCSGSTGHAEVVQITYNEDMLTYGELLDLFFRAHDPTTLNRQGADKGTQYRSIIQYHNPSQREEAEAAKARAAAHFDVPIVTEISPADTFYAAEAHHQNYFRDNPNAGYCRAVIRPKLEKLADNQRIVIKGSSPFGE